MARGSEYVLERMGFCYNSNIKKQKIKTIIIPHLAFGHMLKIKARMSSTKSFKSYLLIGKCRVVTLTDDRRIAHHKSQVIAWELEMTTKRNGIN